jgi:hypothetical protein
VLYGLSVDIPVVIRDSNEQSVPVATRLQHFTITVADFHQKTQEIIIALVE